MSNTKDIILQKVRFFFKNITWKKFLTFLFFIILSSIFWMMQIYRQKFEATQVIPIKYVNVPDSIIFVNELPTHINTRIKDDGILLFRYYFTKDRDSLEINVREIVNESSTNIIQGGVMEQLIKSKLFVSSDLLTYSPSYISFQHVILNETRLPVIYDGHINLDPGYIIDGDLTIDPEFVKAYGSKENLDALKYAHTEADTLTDITEDKIVPIKIKPIRGVKFVPNIVYLTIPVDKYNQKDIMVPVRCENLPPNMKIRFFPSSVKITMYVGKKRYNDITAEDFDVIVDYEDLKNLKDSTIPVRIVKSPDFVRTQNPEPSEVEYIIEQQDLDN